MAGTIHAPKLNYYYPYELKTVLRTGQCLIEGSSGIVFIAIAHPDGFSIRKMAAKQYELPTFVRWGEAGEVYAIVEVLPCNIQAGVIMRSDP